MSQVADWTYQVDRYLGKVEQDDWAGALEQVRGLRAAGHDVLTIIHRLLAPAQLRIGELWLSDRWSVAQEHAATAISETVLAALGAERERADRVPADAQHVVVACVEQEFHSLPALMVSEHLWADGFSVSFLGANSSTAAVVRQVHAVGPVAVMMSCSLASYLPLVRRQLEAVRETGTPVVVGGSAFDAEGRRARALGATAFSRTAEGVGDIVRSLPTSVPPAPPQTHAGSVEAFVVFGGRERLADEVHARLLRTLTPGTDGPALDGEWLRVLDEQLPHFVGSVAGALVTDDPRIVAEALTWADAVLRHRHAPAGSPAALRAALQEALHDLPVAAKMVESAAQPG